MWSSELLRPNPNAQVTVSEVGASKRRLVIVDDFYAEAERLADLALGLHYVADRQMHGNFPGGRAAVSLDLSPMVALLGHLWGTPLGPFHAYLPAIFSVIVNQGQRLNNGQRQPHIDPGVSAMVYLNPDELCSGGTGLYRHKPTGLERIPTEPTPELLELAAGLDLDPASVQEDYAGFQDRIVFNPLFARKDDSYINEGNEFWELIHLVEMRFNRLVLFDGRIPHSQYLTRDQFTRVPRLNQILYLKELAPASA